MFCGHSLSRTPPACLENLALSAQRAWCGIEAMGETHTQLDEPGRGVHVGKDKIIHEEENWRWKGGWTERGGRGAVLGAKARLPEYSGRRPPLGWVLRVGAQRRRHTTGCALEVQFSLRLGDSSLSKIWNWFHLYFSAECGSLNQNVCAEAKPSGFQFYLGYTTKAKGWITPGPLLSLLSGPCPIFLPHIRVLLFLAHGPSLCSRLPITDSSNPNTGKNICKNRNLEYNQYHLIFALTCSLWRKFEFGNDYSFQNDCWMVPTTWLAWYYFESQNPGYSGNVPCWVQTHKHPLKGSCHVLHLCNK